MLLLAISLSEVDANRAAVWDPPLVRAVSSLQYQGYVCPGILVTLAGEEELEVLQVSAGREELVTASAGRLEPPQPPVSSRDLPPAHGKIFRMLRHTLPSGNEYKAQKTLNSTFKERVELAVHSEKESN